MLLLLTIFGKYRNDFFVVLKAWAGYIPSVKNI